MALFRQEPVVGKHLAQESYSLFREQDNKSGMARAHLLLCFLDDTQTPEQLQSCFEHALILAREAQDDVAASQSIFRIGETFLRRLDFDAARAYFTESLHLSRKAGARTLTALTLTNLAGIARSLGDYISARTQYEESLAIYREVRDRWVTPYALGNLAMLHHLQGDNATARSLLEECLGMALETGDRSYGAGIHSALGSLSLLEGDYETARSLIERSLEMEKSMEDGWTSGAYACMLGWVLAHGGDYSRAEGLFKEGLKVTRRVSSMLHRPMDDQEVVIALVGLASLSLLREDELERAAKLLCAAEFMQRSLVRSFYLEGTIEYTVTQKEYERMVSSLQTRRDIDTWQRAWEEGQAMTVEQVVSYALGEGQEVSA
jgi:tetratricopeptide (TPR) repeat protein